MLSRVLYVFNAKKTLSNTKQIKVCLENQLSLHAQTLVCGVCRVPFMHVVVSMYLTQQ